MDYTEFLTGKFTFSQAFGVGIEQSAINPMLKPHQKDIVQWAVRKGRAAIFASFGLGKTFMQIEILRILQAHKPGKYLIIAPLGVRQEFRRDAEKLGVEVTFVKRSEEVSGDGIYVTNYESVRDSRLDIHLFVGVSLDEASVLRSYGSDTYQTFLTMFGDIPYRFVATACPSPNRFKELIHYAGFLGVMDTGQALTRFFQRDSTQANNLTLFPHMKHEFFCWLHSWSIFLQKPSDIGYSDDGYILPPLSVTYHEIPARNLSGVFERDGQGQLLRDAAMGLRDAAREKRESIEDRVSKMMEIIEQQPEAHYILWHDLEAERHAIREALPKVSEVYGSLDIEKREQRVIDFSEGRSQFLSTKPELSGSGCNFQRYCHKAIFLGIGYKFNDFIQSIHRIHRFQQEYPCEIHIIHTETEREVMKTLQRKWAEYEELTKEMSEIIRDNGLTTDNIERDMKRSLGVKRHVEKGQLFEVAHNDCVEEVKLIDDNSIDLIHTSIPFGNHYEYSESFNDFGHNPDNSSFFKQMEFLTPDLLRILKPGRIAAIHVKDRINFGNVTGYGMPTVEPFHADCIYHYRQHGFAYMGMITIVTDVVRENNQTYRLGWTENCKDSSKMGVGSPEYLLLFRKLPSDTSNSYADEPVTKTKQEYSRARWQVDAHAFWRSSGNRFLSSAELKELPPGELVKRFTEETLKSIYNHDEHIAIGEALEERNALPATFMAIAPGSHADHVWHDVNRMRTLNGEQTNKGLVNHICPLQFDIVDRVITRFTNPGELVFDPFGGLMTVPVRALKLGRRARAAELNAEYFRDGVVYLRNAEIEARSPSLFDLLAEEDEVTV